MKKSTVLILAVVFIVSVFVVGIFGMKNVPYNQIIYVEEIVLDSVTLSNGKSVELKKDDSGYYIRIEYEENLSVIVSYNVSPSNATDRNLNVTVENINKNSDGELQLNGSILLKNKGAVRITYRADDQAGASYVVLTIYTK